jgi:hypothetical protein
MSGLSETTMALLGSGDADDGSAPRFGIESCCCPRSSTCSCSWCRRKDGSSDCDCDATALLRVERRGMSLRFKGSERARFDDAMALLSERVSGICTLVEAAGRGAEW